jgi:hypothetical protein
VTLSEFAALRARQAAQARPKPPNELLLQMEAIDAALNANAVKPPAPIPPPKGPMIDAPPDLL